MQDRRPRLSSAVPEAFSAAYYSSPAGPFPVPPPSNYFAPPVPDVAEPAGLFVLLAPFLLDLTELLVERWCFFTVLDDLEALDEFAGVDAPPAGA
jgi:hypothetical protein